MQTKICRICSIEKSIDDFHKQKGGKFGVRKICKTCSNEERKTKDISRRREIQRKYLTKKRKDDIFRLRASLGTRLSMSLKSKGLRKSRSTLDVLGITIPEFKIYLENLFVDGMTWSNYGSFWHVDHIIPISSGKTIEEVNKLSHYTNLQPLEGLKNIRKSNKITTI